MKHKRTDPRDLMGFPDVSRIMDARGDEMMSAANARERIYWRHVHRELRAFQRGVLLGLVYGFFIGAALFPLLYLLFNADFPGSAVFYGLQEDHWFVTFLLGGIQ